MSLSNRESFKDEQSMCYHYHFHCHCFCYCYCYLRSEDTGSLWMSTASTILTSTLPLPMNLPPLRSGFQNCDYEEKEDGINFQVFLQQNSSKVWPFNGEWSLWADWSQEVASQVSLPRLPRICPWWRWESLPEWASGTLRFAYTSFLSFCDRNKFLFWWCLSL